MRAKPYIKTCINLNIVECKYSNYTKYCRCNKSINLNILESIYYELITRIIPKLSQNLGKILQGLICYVTIKLNFKIALYER